MIGVDEPAGSLLRDARARAGLSQAELGRRAGVTQSVISAYEAGARQPALPTLARLIRAAGFDLDMKLRPATDRLVGPVGRRLTPARRAKAREIAAAHGVTNLRVFGSVVRGEDRPNSDLDLLADIAGRVGLVGLGRCQRDLEQLLGVPVDLIPARDLKPGVAEEVLTEAIPL